MTEIECVVRHLAEADRPFIFSSWTRGAYEIARTQLIPRERFIPHQLEHVDRCLARASTLVAVHPDDPNAVIGYLCHELVKGALVVHWAYTKRLFRRRGIGRLLLETAQPGAAGRPVLFTQASKHVEWLRGRLVLAHDPYLLGEL